MSEVMNTYIVDDGYIRETERSIGLPVGRRGSYTRVSTVWFPKSQVRIQSLGQHRVRVSVPAWLVDKKRDSGEMLRSFDILCI